MGLTMPTHHLFDDQVRKMRMKGLVEYPASWDIQQMI